jgi:hypothetical protein
MKAADETIQVYIVKYALTQGIRKELLSRSCGKGLYFDNNYTYYSEKDIAHTEAEAMEKAEAMRAKKIASLQKQIIKLENLKIKIK